MRIKGFNRRVHRCPECGHLNFVNYRNKPSSNEVEVHSAGYCDHERGELINLYKDGAISGRVSVRWIEWADWSKEKLMRDYPMAGVCPGGYYEK